MKTRFTKKQTFSLTAASDTVLKRIAGTKQLSVGACIRLALIEWLVAQREGG